MKTEIKQENGRTVQAWPPSLARIRRLLRRLIGSDHMRRCLRRRFKRCLKRRGRRGRCVALKTVVYPIHTYSGSTRNLTTPLLSRADDLVIHLRQRRFPSCLDCDGRHFCRLPANNARHCRWSYEPPLLSVICARGASGPPAYDSTSSLRHAATRDRADTPGNTRLLGMPRRWPTAHSAPTR